LVVVVVHIEIFLGYLAYINCAYDLVCHFVQPNGYYQGSKTDTRLVLSTYADHIKVFYQNSFPLKRFFSCLLILNLLVSYLPSYWECILLTCCFVEKNA
jgi:hypothetical protein